jgi:hypothetical protein
VSAKSIYLVAEEKVMVGRGKRTFSPSTSVALFNNAVFSLAAAAASSVVALAPAAAATAARSGESLG